VISDVSQTDLRWTPDPETFDELVPLLRDHDTFSDVEIVLVHYSGPLPAGYNDPERWWNAVRLRSGAMEKTLLSQESVSETLENLKTD